MEVCALLPLGNTWVIKTEPHLCLDLARSVLAQQSPIHGWHVGKEGYTCARLVTHGEDTYLTLHQRLGIRALPHSEAWQDPSMRNRAMVPDQCSLLPPPFPPIGRRISAAIIQPAPRVWG